MGLQLITTTSVMVFMMVTMASAGEFRPVTEIPLPETSIANPMAEKVEFVTTITPDEDGTGGFVATMAGPLNSFPCPVVIWAATGVQLRDIVSIPDDTEDGYKRLDRALWKNELKLKELAAKGLIDTATGEKFKESLRNEIDELKNEVLQDLPEAEVNTASSEIISSTSAKTDCQDAFSKTWTDVFSSIKRVSSDYTIISHKGFVEIAWGSKKSVEQLKRNMSSEVPPITFIASKSNQILPMWQEVSGLCYVCEASLLKRLEPQVETQTDEWPESVADDCMSADEDEIKEYEEVFTVTHTVPVNAFMNQLALNLGGEAWQDNGKWFIGEYRDQQTLTLCVSENLRILKKQHDRPSFDVMKRLSRLGLPALPILLKEFETAQGDYFCSLAEVLSRIDCPERDTTFLNILRNWTQDSHQDIEGISTMIHTLARRDVEDSLIYSNMFGTETEYVARKQKIDLVKFYHPGPPEDPASVLIAEGNVMESFTNPEYSEVIRILYETISQRWGGTKPLLLEGIEKDGKGVTTFSGSLSGQGAAWTVRIGKPVNGNAAVYMVEYHGPLDAKAYEGIAEKRKDRWLLARWWMKWIS